MHIFMGNNVSEPVSVSESDCETDERLEKKIVNTTLYLKFMCNSNSVF